MNAVGIPEPSDIRALLEGYGLDLQSTLSLTGNLTSGSAIITDIDTTSLSKYMNIFGSGIPAAAQIASVDIVDSENGQITLSVPSTEAGTGIALTVTFFSVLSDEWIQSRLTSRILPWVQSKTRQSFSEIKTVTEYYDGTGSPLMILRRRPIVQLLSISYTNVDSNLYYLTPSAMQVIADEGILKAKANFNESSYIPIFYKGDRNIRITYQYGFAECPTDVAEAISLLVADVCLEHIASKTGGGNLGLQGFNRDYGAEGKWTIHRKNMVKQAWALLRAYVTGAAS